MFIAGWADDLGVKSVMPAATAIGTRAAGLNRCPAVRIPTTRPIMCSTLVSTVGGTSMYAMVARVVGSTSR